MDFRDGIKNFVNRLANSRNGRATNGFVSEPLHVQEMKAIYKTGIGNKIVRLKSGFAFDDSITFINDQDAVTFHDKLESECILATQYMLAYGRGVILVHHRGDNLAQPLGKVDADSVILSTFSGDLVTVGNVSRDLQGGRYLKPESFNVEGEMVHHSRVIDFNYIKPPEREAAIYRYGGISEYELIYNQLINDGIIERASSAIVEKSSTFVMKVEGFKDALSAGDESALVEYFANVENIRSMYGSLIMDSADSAESVTQQLSNLDTINEASLRRLAMVTGIPLTYLVGEAVRGLNASGDHERDAMLDMIQQLQKSYLTSPVWRLCDLLGLGVRTWADDQGVTDRDRAEHEAKIIANAKLLWEMGEDHSKYLADRNITSDAVNVDDFWTAKTVSGGGDADEDDIDLDPSESLNGAQVTALLAVIEKVQAGIMDKPTAQKVLVASFPIDVAQAQSLLADVKEGEETPPELTDPSQPKPTELEVQLSDALARVAAKTD